MKKPVESVCSLFLLTMLLAAAPAFADASRQGCLSSHNTAAGCVAGDPLPSTAVDPAPTAVPEPGVTTLLITGLLGVSGIALFRRPRTS